MIDVTLSSPSKGAFTGDVALWPAAFNAVSEGVLGTNMVWRKDTIPGPNGLVDIPKRGSAASIATLIGPYRTVDAVVDQDGNVTTPAQHTTRDFMYIRFESEEDWDTLLAFTNPVGIMPGGTRIEYATGLSGGDFGTIPANGVQLVWA